MTPLSYVMKLPFKTESSSGGSSDWEKEFDLEMTEDEINEALLEDIENIDDVS